MATRTRCRRSRGRSVLLWGVALFLLLQLAVSVVVDRYGMPVRLPEAVADLLPLASRPELADVIVLGSSRSYLGIDPQHATQDLSQCIGKPVNVFRAAIFAGDLPTEEYMLQRVLALGGRPRIALIEISPEFLARHNDWMLEHIRRQVTWENSPIYLPQIIHESKIGPYLRGRCLPLYAYRLPLWQEAQRLWMTGWAGWMQAYRLAGRLAGPREVDAALVKNRLGGGERYVAIDEEEGKPSRSRFVPQAQYRDATLCEVEIASGRTHQIRVHAAALGHPVAGDRKYGTREQHRPLRALGLRRLFLHAHFLELPAADGFLRLKLSAPLPAELREFLERLS